MQSVLARSCQAIPRCIAPRLRVGERARARVQYVKGLRTRVVGLQCSIVSLNSRSYSRKAYELDAGDGGQPAEPLTPG